MDITKPKKLLIKKTQTTSPKQPQTLKKLPKKKKQLIKKQLIKRPKSKSIHGLTQNLSMAGTSGFYYDWWFYHPEIGFPAFYPPGLPKKDALTYYSNKLPIVELNSTYYKLPSKESVKEWYRKTPKDFKFIAKLSRHMTTFKKLIDFSQLFGEFWFDRVEHLGDKLVGILVQMPPNFVYYPNKLTNLQRIEEAGKYTQSLGDRLPVPIFIEFRDPSWFHPDVYRVLKNIGWSLVPVYLNNEFGEFGKMPTGLTPELSEIPITLPGHIYFRFHGTWPLPYQGGYSIEDLLMIYSWAESQGLKHSFYLFNNTDSFQGEEFTPVTLILKKQGHLMINPSVVEEYGGLIPHAVYDAQQMNILIDR